MSPSDNDDDVEDAGDFMREIQVKLKKLSAARDKKAKAAFESAHAEISQMALESINNHQVIVNSQVKSYSEKFDALMSDREELIAKIKGEHSNILKLNAWFEKETKMLCKQGEKDAATFLALAAACQDAQENFASVISATNLPDKPFDSVVVTEKFKSPLPPPTRSKQRVLKTVAADSGVSKKKNTFAYGEGAAGLAVGALFVLGLI